MSENLNNGEQRASDRRTDIPAPPHDQNTSRSSIQHSIHRNNNPSPLSPHHHGMPFVHNQTGRPVSAMQDRHMWEEWDRMHYQMNMASTNNPNASNMNVDPNLVHRHRGNGRSNESLNNRSSSRHGGSSSHHTATRASTLNNHMNERLHHSTSPHPSRSNTGDMNGNQMYSNTDRLPRAMNSIESKSLMQMRTSLVNGNHMNVHEILGAMSQPNRRMDIEGYADYLMRNADHTKMGRDNTGDSRRGQKRPHPHHPQMERQENIMANPEQMRIPPNAIDSNRGRHHSHQVEMEMQEKVQDRMNRNTNMMDSNAKRPSLRDLQGLPVHELQAHAHAKLLMDSADQMKVAESLLELSGEQRNLHRYTTTHLMSNPEQRRRQEHDLIDSNSKQRSHHRLNHQNEMHANQLMANNPEQMKRRMMERMGPNAKQSTRTSTRSPHELNMHANHRMANSDPLNGNAIMMEPNAQQNSLHVSLPMQDQLRGFVGNNPPTQLEHVHASKQNPPQRNRDQIDNFQHSRMENMMEYSHGVLQPNQFGHHYEQIKEFRDRRPAQNQMKDLNVEMDDSGSFHSRTRAQTDNEAATNGSVLGDTVEQASRDGGRIHSTDHLNVPAQYMTLADRISNSNGSMANAMNGDRICHDRTINGSMMEMDTAGMNGGGGIYHDNGMTMNGPLMHRAITCNPKSEIQGQSENCTQPTAQRSAEAEIAQPCQDARSGQIAIESTKKDRILTAWSAGEKGGFPSEKDQDFFWDNHGISKKELRVWFVNRRVQELWRKQKRNKYVKKLKNSCILDLNRQMLPKKKIIHVEESFSVLREAIQWAIHPDNNDTLVYPNAPLAELWVKTFDDKDKAAPRIAKWKLDGKHALTCDHTLLGRRWLWDEGHFTDGICHTGIGAENKIAKDDGFVPIMLRAYCNCGQDHLQDLINKIETPVRQERGARRSARSGTSVKMSSVSRVRVFMLAVWCC